MTTHDIQPTRPTLASYYQKAKREENLYNSLVYQALQENNNTTSQFAFEVRTGSLSPLEGEAVLRLVEARKSAVTKIRQIEEEMRREYGKSQYLSVSLDLPFYPMSFIVPESLSDESSYRTLYRKLTDEGKTLTRALKRFYDGGVLFVDERDYRNTLVALELTYNTTAALLAQKASKQFNTTMTPGRIELDEHLGVSVSRFPFDPTGLNPLNHINDTITITNDGQESARYLIPRHAPFFADSLRLSRIQDDGTLIPLVLNEDFYCGGLFADILEHTQDGKLVAGIIIFDDEGVNGQFLLDYQTLGGDYCIDADGLGETLVKFIDSPMIADWGEIVGKPLELPAEKTQHDISDFRSFEDVVRAVVRLTEVVESLVALQAADEQEDGMLGVANEVRRYLDDMNKLYQKVLVETDVGNYNQAMDQKVTQAKEELMSTVTEMVNTAKRLAEEQVNRLTTTVNNTVVPNLERKINEVKERLNNMQDVNTAIVAAKQSLREEYTQLNSATNTRVDGISNRVDSLVANDVVVYGNHQSLVGGEAVANKQISTSGVHLVSPPVSGSDKHITTELKLKYVPSTNSGVVEFEDMAYVAGTGDIVNLGFRAKDFLLGKSVTNKHIGHNRSVIKHLEKLYELVDGNTSSINTLSATPAFDPNQIISHIRIGDSGARGEIWRGEGGYRQFTGNVSRNISNLLRIHKADGLVAKDILYENVTNFGTTTRSLNDTVNYLSSRIDAAERVLLSDTLTHLNRDNIRRNLPVMTHDDTAVGISAIRLSNGVSDQTVELRNTNGVLTSDKNGKFPDLALGTKYPSLISTLDKLSKNTGSFIPTDRLQPIDALGTYSKTLNKIPVVRNDGSTYLGQAIVLTNDQLNGVDVNQTTEGATYISYLYDSKQFWNAINVSGIVHCDALLPRSDEKLKENIQKITDPIGLVKQIGGYHYDWKQNRQRSMGVIAQEVEAVLPELVSTNDDTKSVNYNGLVALLVEVVKHQQDEIDTLRDMINQLKGN